ncbi:protein of unknown function DUF58 [[Leptolyngbya] sp. PCC 7376]|uniref:DUF58 domain-containing protein n=1 Tax=[Leptolyngbya] sp. PCC 7376 TaxID=111781 RepID=UPI00029EF99D|nr:DUF58 domain-containing protein [[Leptolyngbya] sp. PCC 7376]AFY40081.1 protein of unknown function DUF58 [[Leptolyngbya] sp. PCC 7376]
MARNKNNWYSKLERRWVAPAYGGGVLGAIGLSFFGAATNTMAGWLYVISGTIFAILFLGAILPIRSLKELEIGRSPISPVSVSEVMQVKIQITNQGKAAKSLVAAMDELPPELGAPRRKVIEMLPPKDSLEWVYEIDAQKRGIFHWETIALRTANPLGLFWCRRSRSVPARAVIYPQILPLNACPIIDSIGADESTKFQSDRLYQNATEGLTKSIRNYRVGDPMRLIHWRSSARFGEFKVRELEITTGGEEVIICLDHQFDWNPDSFEQAVSAAASLFFYARRSQLNVKLWTAQTGILNARPIILESLAGIQPDKTKKTLTTPDSTLLWLTQNKSTLDALPKGSRWVFFANNDDSHSPKSKKGLTITQEKALQIQLQAAVSSPTLK